MQQEHYNAPSQHYERLVLHPRAGHYSLASEKHPNRNEDAARQGMYTFVVADGVGGHAAGEVASNLAIDEVGKYLEVPLWETTDDNARGAVTEAVSRAHGAVVAAAKQANNDMATMLVGARYYNVPATNMPDGRRRPAQTHAAVFNVGDTRAYLYSPMRGRNSPSQQPTLETLTLDHAASKKGGRTEAWEEQVILADAEATINLGSHIGAFALRNHAPMAVGWGTSEPEVRTFTTLPEDVLLLCTDGIHDLLTERELLDLMTLTETGRLPRNSTIHDLLKLDQAGDGELRAAVTELLADLGNPELGAKAVVLAARARSHDTAHLRVRGAHMNPDVNPDLKMGGKKADDMTAMLIKTPRA